MTDNYNNRQDKIHIGLIPDGNRRYARLHHKPLSWGYLQGALKLEEFMAWATRQGSISQVTIYLMSTENLHRPKKQLGVLWDIYQRKFHELAKSPTILDNKIKVKILGDTNSWRPDVLEAAKAAMSATHSFTKYLLNVMVAYSSRYEILNSVRQCIKNKIIPPSLKPPVSYIALDISTDMLALAIRNIKMEIRENLNTQTFVMDFEEGNFAQITGMLKKVYYPNNLLMVLCNTIGNAFDKHRVLANIRESMGFSDYLLIGMELLRENRDVKDIVEHYRTDHVYNLIFIGLEKAGVKREDGHFKVEFNREKSQVETCFIFDRDVKTRFEGEKLSFNRGDKVILMISYKSTKQELEKLLEKMGFRVDRFFVNKEGNYALILCHPSKL